MKTWKVRIKERGRKDLLTPEYVFFNTGEKTRQEMIEFWGLENDDVEWFELELIEEWSEGDRFYMEAVTDVIRKGGSIRPEMRKEVVAWLESLKERVCKKEGG